MAILQWDGSKPGDRLYETGIDHVALYLYNKQTEKYDKASAWSGVSSISESPSGADTTALYADNIKYLELTAREDFGCTIEAYMYPDDWGLCDGSAGLDDVAGVSIGQQARQTFCLAYRTNVGDGISGNDYGYKLHLVYNAKAAPSERAYSTINDSPEAISFSWTVTTTSVAFQSEEFKDKYKPTSIITVDSTKFVEQADKAKLAALETILFGSETQTPYLPSPDEVLTILKTGSVG